MEKELKLKIDAAAEKLQTAERSGDLRDALAVLKLLLDAVEMLGKKPPH
jgi:hypothetical protein